MPKPNLETLTPGERPTIVGLISVNGVARAIEYIQWEGKKHSQVDESYEAEATIPDTSYHWPLGVGEEVSGKISSL